MERPDDLHFEEIERALALSERLRARGATEEADRLLGRAIQATGVELARVDPVVAAMLELDAELLRITSLRVAAARAGIDLRAGDLVPVRRRPR